MALTQVTPDVVHNVQSNITQVGTLSNLTVTGNITAAAGNIGNLQVVQDIYGGAVGFNINPLYRLDVFAPGSAGTVMRIGSSYYQSNYMAKADLTEAIYTAGVDSNFGREAYSGSDYSSEANTYPYSLRTYGVNRVTIAGNGANVTVNITTPSTSTTTGALIVKGGVGVAGNVNATNLTGTVLTASQTNITELGTITTGTWSASTIAVNKGGTGATTAATALDNLLPSGEQTGYVLATSGAGSYFWTNPSTGGSTVGQQLTTTRQANTATAGQSLFTLVSGRSYTPGSGQLRVYLNGVRQYPSEYTETSNVSYTITGGVSSGDIVLAEIDQFSTFNNYANLTYASNVGNIAAAGLTVQSAIASLETTKATLASPVFSGLLTASNISIVPGSSSAWLNMTTSTRTGQLNYSNIGFRLIDNGTTTLVVDASGDLGVGVDNPGYKLHVRDTPDLDVGFACQTGQDIMVRLDTQGDSGRYTFWGSDNSAGSAFYANSSANACIFGTSTTTNIQFVTDFTERVRILGTTGNVGINTLTPTEKLHVVGNAIVTGTVIGNVSGTANNASYLGGTPAASYAQTSTVIGVGQTWANVTASRAASTTYTNSTGKPIFISVRWERDDGTLELTVDGLLIGRTGQTAGPVLYTLTAIVPAGSTYSATTTGSGGTLFWYELR